MKKETLPKLPKILKKREAYVTPKVHEYLLKYWPRSYVAEVKVDGGKLKDHQAVVLAKVASGRWGYKPPDMGRRNPVDLIGIVDGDALFVTVLRDNTCVCINSRDNSITHFKI